MKAIVINEMSPNYDHGRPTSFLLEKPKKSKYLCDVIDEAIWVRDTIALFIDDTVRFRAKFKLQLRK